jgi:hypothetical protein
MTLMPIECVSRATAGRWRGKRRSAALASRVRAGVSSVRPEEDPINFELQLVFVPVSDVDAAKAFYVDKAGFNADHDQRVHPELRFVQLTPPGSACSIAIGEWLIDSEPGSLKCLQLVVEKHRSRSRELSERGC